MSWRLLAANQHGVITRHQLGAAGVSSRSLHIMVDSGELVRVAQGTFLVGGAPETFRSRLWISALATGGTIGFASAAQTWGITPDQDAQIHVVLPHARRVYPPDYVRVHRTPVPLWALACRDGLSTTSMSWTLLDHASTLRSGHRISLIDRGMQRGWVTEADVRGRLKRYPGRTGNAALRRLLPQLGDGAAAQSERKLHQLLRRAGIGGWRPNHPLWSNGELACVIDVAFPDRRIAIEVDGMAHHIDSERFTRDRRRQNRLVLDGWLILRFTWEDLVERPAYVIREIRAALAGTAAQPRPVRESLVRQRYI